MEKIFSKQKVGVTVMLVLITAAVFLAIGWWAGARENTCEYLGEAAVELPDDYMAIIDRILEEEPCATTSPTPNASTRNLL